VKQLILRHEEFIGPKRTYREQGSMTPIPKRTQKEILKEILKEITKRDRKKNHEKGLQKEYPDRIKSAYSM